MRKSLPVLLFLLLFSISTARPTIAGYRSYGVGYGSHHHYSRSFTHYRPYFHGHSYHSDHIWTDLGIGFFSGAIIGSVLYQPPRQRTIIYNSPPPVIVYSTPVVLNQRYSPIFHQPQDLVLRRVRTTPEMLNIRSGPDVYAAIAGQIPQNTILDVLGAAPEWLYIRTETGQYGWIMVKYTREAEGPVG
jgi:uncharacterized protein YgiM (DUF1202 family)